MLLNMCIHLSDSGQDVSILTAAYQALAEAHFKLEEHEQSINAGKECFKFRPHKSEVFFNCWDHSLKYDFMLLSQKQSNGIQRLKDKQEHDSNVRNL